jgi:hydrogenase/urease accessory protein HupE
MRVFRFFLLLWAAVSLRAHDPGISTVQVEVRADALVLVNGFAPADAAMFLPPEKRTEGSWSEAEFEAAKPGLSAIAPGLWRVKVDGREVGPATSLVQLLPGDNVSFEYRFDLSKMPGTVTLEATRLGELPTTHRQFLILADVRGSTLAKKLLSGRDPVLEADLRGPTVGTAETAMPGTPAATASPVPPAPAESGTFWGFLKLGVEHIWTGYDHLLFLFALLIVCSRFGSIVGIISCFTLAHSITLAAATLEWVEVPSHWVEPAIAASIVYVGLENLWLRGREPKARWALTFCFGLIHGFGFAGVLRDLGLGRGQDGIALPLFSFNLGVELGQIAVAAIVLPGLWQLRKKPEFVRRGVPALSILVTLAGFYWLLDRTVLR